MNPHLPALPARPRVLFDADQSRGLPLSDGQSFADRPEFAGGHLGRKCVGFQDRSGHGPHYT